MTQLTWDAIGDHLFETGVDHGVLYVPDNDGTYPLGVAWNGLVSITESPTGAEANAQYADNMKYLNLYSAEEFGATLEAFTYPPEWNQFDGLATPTPGVYVGQQSRRAFGLCYRTLLGNDVEGTDFGYKLKLVYGATASPSEKNFQTVNDSPEAITFSWEIATIGVPVTGLKNTSILTIVSTEVNPAALEALEEILFGSPGVDPRLPMPDEVIAILDGTPTAFNVVVAGDADSVDITGTTANVLFTVEAWDGDEFVAVSGGTAVNEAAAEALVLTNGVHRITLSGAPGYYLPVAQQDVFVVTVT